MPGKLNDYCRLGIHSLSVLPIDDVHLEIHAVGLNGIYLMVNKFLSIPKLTIDGRDGEFPVLGFEGLIPSALAASRCSQLWYSHSGPRRAQPSHQRLCGITMHDAIEELFFFIGRIVA